MALPVIGGPNYDNCLVCACKVVDTYTAAIAVGDLVEWSTSSNMAINSHATDRGFEHVGEVIALSEDSTVATVRWFGYNKIIQVTYSGTIALGNYPMCCSATYDKVVGSGSATSSVAKARVVAKDVPASGEVLVAVR